MKTAKDDRNQETKVHKEEADRNLEFQLIPDKNTEALWVEMVTQDVELYESARTEWLEIREECWDLYEGIREEKNDPWPGCSNISTMIATTVCDLIHSRLVPMVSNPSLIFWRPREKNDIDTADNVNIFMKWAVENDMEFDNVIDDMCKGMVVDGTVGVKVYWDISFKWVQRKIPVKFLGFKTWKYKIKYEYKKIEKPRVVVLDIEDVLLPFDAKNSQDCVSVIHRNFYTLPELKQMQSQGQMKNVDESFEVGLSDYLEKQEGGKRAKAEAEGRKWSDARKNTFPILVYEWYGKVEYDGHWREVQLMVCPSTQRLISAVLLVDISRVEERPIIVEPFLRRPGRIYGKSVCEQVRHLQKEMDAIHNQRIDAGTIAIAPFFFYRPASGFKPEDVEIGPGYGIPVDDPQHDVLIPTFNANMMTVSFQEERIIVELIEKLTSVSSYQLGRESEIAGSRATATGTMAIIGQGEQKFSLLGKRAQLIVAKVLTAILRKYQENMDTSLAERVLGKEGPLFPEGMTPEDIAGQYDAYLELDLAASNKMMEKQTWQVLFTQMANDPFVNADPARAWEVRNRYYRVVGVLDVEKFIGPKPPSTNVNMEAEDEFNQMMQGKEVTPQPNEDAFNHLLSHLAQKDSPRFEKMPIEYRQFLMKHITETQQLYMKQLKQRQDQARLAQMMLSDKMLSGMASNTMQASNVAGMSAPDRNNSQGEGVPASPGSQMINSAEGPRMPGVLTE